MSNKKQSLKAVTDKLNEFGFMSDQPVVSLEDVLQGNFPWSKHEKELGNLYYYILL